MPATPRGGFLPSHKVSDTTVAYEFSNRLEGEDLPSGPFNQPAHVFPPNSEAPSRKASNYLVPRPSAFLILQGNQTKNSADLVVRRSVVFGDLGLNNHLRIRPTRDDEVRSLIEARNTLGASGLVEANTGPS